MQGFFARFLRPLWRYLYPRGGFPVDGSPRYWRSSRSGHGDWWWGLRLSQKWFQHVESTNAATVVVSGRPDIRKHGGYLRMDQPHRGIPVLDLRLAMRPSGAPLPGQQHQPARGRPARGAVLELDVRLGLPLRERRQRNVPTRGLQIMPQLYRGWLQSVLLLSGNINQNESPRLFRLFTGCSVPPNGS